MSAPALVQVQQGITQMSADNLNTYESTCDTLAQLRAFVPAVGQQVYVRGQAAAGDGYQGAFWWNPNLTGATDDNINTIIPGGVTTGGWVRLPEAVFPNKSTVAALPVVTAANQGMIGYATNGRNSGESSASGTGCLVTVNKNGVWAACWSGVLVTA